MTPTPHAPSGGGLEAVRTFIEAHADRFQRELFDFLKIPSVSSDSARRADTLAAAEWAAASLRAAGLEVDAVKTAGFPVVFGERTGKAGGPSLLVYGHYDVQPPEPLDKWTSPPFEPTVVNGSVVARGATDDKGQAFALVCGIRAALAAGIGTDVTIKVILEGEEEIGSGNLVPFIRAERDRLKADVVVISDSSQLGPGAPAITYGLRGIACLELVVRGPRRDLHSGSYGGAVANPANVLARILNACQAPFGRVAIPGFYDRVRELDDREREAFRTLPFDEAAFRSDVGVPKLWGEEGYSTLERKWTRPTLDINGLTSGHQGEGVKTVLPAEARAKLSMRLVPDQDPDEILRLTQSFLRSVAPETVEIDFIPGHGAHPVVVDCDTEAFRAAERAVEVGFGRTPLRIREGGTIPVVNTFKTELGLDSLLIGLGLPNDGAHGPNERFSLADFRRGILTMAALIDEFSRGAGARA
jgi:acetylornithine deacetylase/succinyl-diaminopimelate desuccinylase-like protein